MKKLKVVELYAGTARSVEPFRRWNRAEISLLMDFNKYARTTYLHNYPGAPYVRRNIANTSANEFLALAGGRIDILLGCPPCQGFSETGLRLQDDPRNKHVNHFRKLACATRPLAVVMENVPRAAESKEFNRLVTSLDELGYKWTSAIANSAQYGSAQSRQRLLFIALRKDVGVQPKLPSPTHGGNKRIFSYSTMTFRSPRLHPVELLGITPVSQRLSSEMHQDLALTIGKRPLTTVSDVISDLPHVGTQAAAELSHIKWGHSRRIMRRMERVSEGGRWCGAADHFSHTYGRLHRSGLARTITTFFANAGGGRFWHPTENRSLTVRESARIQGFLDDFQFLDSSKRSAALVGNALDSSLSSICYKTVRAALE